MIRIKIRGILRRVIFNQMTAPWLIRPVLRLHSYCYKLAGELAIMVSDDRIHPKHEIIRYESWFLDQVEPKWTVLDVGSNTGMMANLLAGKAAFVYGIELEKKLVDEAQRKRQLPNIRYFCADATSFKYSECSPIDCITLSNVLEHIEKRTDFLGKLLSEVPWRDPLKKRFLIRVPLITREWIVLYKQQLGLDYRLDHTHCVEHTPELLEQELDKCGIKIIHQDVRFGELFAVCLAGDAEPPTRFAFPSGHRE
jgi:SAM-dependent methyltransferase